MSPLLKTINNDEHFLVVDFVVLFRFRQLTWEKRYRVEVFAEVLWEGTAKGEIRGIGLYVDEEWEIKVFKNRSGRKTGFKEVEGDLTGF